MCKYILFASSKGKPVRLIIIRTFTVLSPLNNIYIIDLGGKLQYFVIKSIYRCGLISVTAVLCNKILAEGIR